MIVVSYAVRRTQLDAVPGQFNLGPWARSVIAVALVWEADQAHLLGLIDRTQDLGLELIAIHPDEGTDSGAADPGMEPGWS